MSISTPMDTNLPQAETDLPNRKSKAIGEVVSHYKDLAQLKIRSPNGYIGEWETNALDLRWKLERKWRVFSILCLAFFLCMVSDSDMVWNS